METTSVWAQAFRDELQKLAFGAAPPLPGVARQAATAAKPVMAAMPKAVPPPMSVAQRATLPKYQLFNTGGMTPQQAAMDTMGSAAPKGTGVAAPPRQAVSVHGPPGTLGPNNQITMPGGKMMDLRSTPPAFQDAAAKMFGGGMPKASSVLLPYFLDELQKIAGADGLALLLSKLSGVSADELQSLQGMKPQAFGSPLTPGGRNFTPATVGMSTKATRMAGFGVPPTPAKATGFFGKLLGK